MQPNKHHHTPETKGSWWKTRDGIIAIIFMMFIGYYLITEHQAHIVPYLPWLILLACPFMHIFMHGGHGGHGGHNHKDDGEK